MLYKSPQKGSSLFIKITGIGILPILPIFWKKQQYQSEEEECVAAV